MNYYKKAGARNEEELAMLQAIEAVIESKQIPRHEIPNCLNLDDLIEVKHLVDSYKGKPSQMNIDQEEEALSHQEQETEINENQPEIEQRESIEAEPEPKEEISEVAAIQEDDSLESKSEIVEQVEPEIELAEIIQDEEFDFIAEDYNPFEEPIIERSYNKEDNTLDVQDHENLDEADSLPELEEAREPTPLDSPSDRTKKKAAEQTADTILKGYSRLAPKPFKWLAKINESKVEKLAFSGRLDLDIEVSEGLTFDDYMKDTNEQIDEIFEVDEDTLEEIREPLIEVLMEQEMELTPQQRLGMAVLSHLMQMFTVAMKLRSQNNRILTYQKELTRLSRTKVA